MAWSYSRSSRIATAKNKQIITVGIYFFRSSFTPGWLHFVFISSRTSPAKTSVSGKWLKEHKKIFGKTVLVKVKKIERKVSYKERSVLFKVFCPWRMSISVFWFGVEILKHTQKRKFSLSKYEV